MTAYSEKVKVLVVGDPGLSTGIYNHIRAVYFLGSLFYRRW